MRRPRWFLILCLSGVASHAFAKPSACNLGAQFDQILGIDGAQRTVFDSGVVHYDLPSGAELEIDLKGIVIYYAAPPSRRIQMLAAGRTRMTVEPGFEVFRSPEGSLYYRRIAAEGDGVWIGGPQPKAKAAHRATEPPAPPPRPVAPAPVPAASAASPFSYDAFLEANRLPRNAMTRQAWAKKVLGFKATASPDSKALKSAYRSAARQYHPDLRPGDAGAATAMQRINEAYDVLEPAPAR